MSASGWWVGVDVGGTFTDVMAVSSVTGEHRTYKVLSRTGEQELGVLAAIDALEIPLSEIDEIVHGHTVGINAVLSRTGGPAALLTTAGHADLLDIGRMDREFGPGFYDPTWLRPHQVRPIVQRENRYPVVERIGYDGKVICHSPRTTCAGSRGSSGRRGSGRSVCASSTPTPTRLTRTGPLRSSGRSTRRPMCRRPGSTR